jgi:uncharacterized phage protein (TIGR01671 family)
MREILFRGKRTDNGEWWCGGLLYDEENNHAFIAKHFEDKAAYFSEVDAETVGQYTGLTDKNGTKIFEGDIFRMEDDMIAVIIFNDGCFRLQVYGVCGIFTESGYDEDGGGYGVIECDPIDWYYIHDMQVIGNIHDNHELLQGGEQT